MPVDIDDILNPKPEPDTAEEQVIAVLNAAGDKGKALTKAEVVSGCRFNWFNIAKPGEGGIFLALAMEAVAHETGVRQSLDSQREAALERLVEKGLVRSKEHNGQPHYWAADAPKALKS